MKKKIIFLPLFYSVVIISGCTHPFEKEYKSLQLGTLDAGTQYISKHFNKLTDSDNIDRSNLHNKDGCSASSCKPDPKEQAIIQTAINECERSIREDFFAEDAIDILTQTASTALAAAGSPTTIITKVLSPIFSSFGINTNSKPPASVLGTVDRTSMVTTAVTFLANNNQLKRNAAYYASLYNATLAACPNNSTIMFSPNHERLHRLNEKNRCLLPIDQSIEDCAILDEKK